MAWRQEADGAHALVILGDEVATYRLPSAPGATTYRARTGLSSIAIDARGERLALLAGGGDVTVHEIGSGRAIAALAGDDTAVAKVGTFLLDDDEPLAIAWPGRYLLARWQPRRETLVRPLDTVVNYRRVVALAGGGLLAAGYGSMLARFAPDGTRHASALRDGGSPIDLVADATGTTVAWLSSRGRVELATVEDGSLGAPRHLVDAPDAARIALSGDARWLALARAEDVLLVECASGTSAAPLTLSGARVAELALSADGRWLAAGTVTGEVWVWRDRERLELIGAGHSERVSGLAFSPRGDWLVSAGWDGVAVRWDLRGLAVEPYAIVKQLESAWGVGLAHAVRVDLR